MNNYKVDKYSSLNFVEWNEFISKSKNATFLFHRDFMEYHKERFEDYSLLVYKKDKIIAVLPANKLGNKIHSHQGLTYGGLILLIDVKFDIVLQIFESLLKYLSEKGFDTLILKEMPLIYNSVFTQETEYLMFILEAKLLKKDTLSVIDLNNRLKISSNRLEGYKRGLKYGLVVKEEEIFQGFWNSILIKNLKEKHNARPVHRIEEITLLKKRFPKNIRQFNVYYKNEIVAGTTIFESKYVVHSQYISGNEKKNKLGSLDFLHCYLIKNVFNDKKYFDFGTSNENGGRQINKGLQFWKEGFGARTVTQDFYEINTSNYGKIKDVFI